MHVVLAGSFFRFKISKYREPSVILNDTFRLS